MLGFQCFAVDVILAFCYAKNWDATKAPDFESDIVIASHAVLSIFTVGKYLGPFVKITGYIPMWFGLNFGPPVTRALFLLRGVCVRPKERAESDTSLHNLLDVDGPD